MTMNMSNIPILMMMKMDKDDDSEQEQHSDDGVLEQESHGDEHDQHSPSDDDEDKVLKRTVKRPTRKPKLKPMLLVKEVEKTKVEAYACRKRRSLAKKLMETGEKASEKDIKANKKAF